MAVPPKVPRLKLPAIIVGASEKPIVIETKDEIADKMPKNIAFEHVSDLTWGVREYAVYAPLGIFK